MSKEDEYKEIFIAEAEENFEELNRLMTRLEKNPSDKKSVDAIFRITHTLKGNSAGMGFTRVSAFAHVLEDLFGEAREGKLELDEPTFDLMYKAVDTLVALVNEIKDGESNVKFRGIKTKMEVLLKNIRATEDQPEINEKETGEVSSPSTPIDESQPEHNEPDSEAVMEPIENQGNNKITFSDLVQVPVRKLDNLLNLVGELVIERDRIIAANSANVDSNEYTRLNRISSDLQYSVMDVRLVQVGFLFNKFHRVIRDAANLEGKNVRLELKGTETEIDRNILQIISDSLIHLIRNAVGHGIEKPEERKKAGKPEEGVITLNAYPDTDAVMLEITDDGAGIDIESVRKKVVAKGLLTQEEARHFSDNDIVLMIFEPGFSTVEKVTAISGRGVGMDVVKKALDSIGGNISVETQVGKGTTFKLRLPSSMAVKGTLLFELSKETYAIPLSYTEAVVSLYKADIHKVASGLMASYLGKTISIIFLKDLFHHEENNMGKIFHKSFNELHPEEKLDIVIITYNNKTVGFVVDKLLQQKEIVEKALTKPFDKVKIISGVTIMGNGHVCLVLNVAEICNRIFSRNISNKNNLTNKTE